MKKPSPVQSWAAWLEQHAASLSLDSKEDRLTLARKLAAKLKRGA